MHYKLLFVGRPNKEKGLPDLLSALSLLQEYNWTLTIAGQLPEEVILTRLPYKQRIHTTGAVPNEMMPSLLNRHDILIVPSHYENFGNIIIEGLACGIPIIAAHTGGMKDLIQDYHNGLFFEPKNHHQLAAKIRYLFDHPEQLTYLGENALKSSARYDWKNIMKQTLKLLKKHI